MSHSSGASGSSLIHLRRPAQLSQDARRSGVEVSVRTDLDTIPVITSSSPASPTTTTTFSPARSGPSLNSHSPDALLKVNYPRPTNALRRASSDGVVSRISGVSARFADPVEGCVDLLRSVKPTVPAAKPRSSWQPDEESALCNYPFCCTMFAQTALSLRPRRHHCRRCGLIFCNNHSSNRVSLQNAEDNDRRIISQRVCDGCYNALSESIAERRESDVPSLTSSADSAVDDTLVNPEPTLGRSLSYEAVEETHPRLAPIEDWMDRSGVLSLYPLAVQASHSRRGQSPTATTRAVAPLFAPSISERRNAVEKKLERLSLRQRRNVRGSWAQTPVGSDADSDNDTDDAGSYRKYAASTGTRTPLERELDWSTF